MARRANSDCEHVPKGHRALRRTHGQNRIIKRRQMMMDRYSDSELEYRNHSPEKKKPRKSGTKSRRRGHNKKELGCLARAISWMIPGKMFSDFMDWAWEKFSCKAVTTFAVCFTFGFTAVSYYFHGTFDIPAIYSLGAGIITGLILFLLVHYNQMAKCVFLICGPEVASFTGRLVLGLFVSWLISKYPMDNIVLNLKEVARGGTCGGKIVAAQGQIMREQILQAQEGLVNDLICHLDTITSPVNHTLQYVNSKLEDLENTIEPVTSAVNDLIEGCDSGVGAAFKRCENSSDFIYRNCIQSNLFGSWNFHCHRFKLNSHICSGLDNAKLCHVFTPLQALGNSVPALRIQVQGIQEALKIEIEHNKQVNISQDVEEKFESMQTGIMQDIRDFSNSADDILIILNYCFLIPLLLLPLKSYWFLRGCLKRINRGRDIKRQRPGASLPPTKCGKAVMYGKTFALLLKLFLTLGVLSIEVGLWVFLSLMRDRGNVNFTFDGLIDFRAGVKKSGIASELAGALLPNLTMSTNYNFTVNLEECLPNPVPISPLFVHFGVIGLYTFLLILCLCSEQILNFRYNIVRFCYRERIRKMQTSRCRPRRRRSFNSY